MDEESDRVARVIKEDLRVRILMWCVEDILELIVVRGGAFLGFG